MKSKITFFSNPNVVVIVLLAAVLSLMMLASVSAKAQNQPDPKSGKGSKTTRPVLKKQDPKHKPRRPADPETCLYFVVTSRLDEQAQALVSASTFKALSENFGDNIVVVMDPSLIPIGTPKQRVHTVNLKITMGRLSDIQADSLSQAIKRDISGPLIGLGRQKIESKSRVPGSGEVFGRIFRQATRGANIDGQDVVLQYWWTVNYQVDGLPPQAESFFWQVVRHRGDEYANQYCFTVVGLGDSFTTIKPYQKDIGNNFLGCDFEAVQPGLYELTLLEVWGRPLLSDWLTVIPKPPAARAVGEVISENEANANCNEQEYDSALKRYKCVASKAQTPCQRRRPNPDGTFTCLDAPSVGSSGGGVVTRPRPRQDLASVNLECGGDPLCGQGGAVPEATQQPAAPVSKPKPLPVPATSVPPVQPPAAEPNGNTGRTGFAGFTPTTDVGEGSEGAKRALGFFCSGSGDAWFTQQWRPGWAFRVNGPMMTKTISDFQSQNGLVVNGQLDAPTRRVLNDIWKANPRLFPDMAQLAASPAPCRVK